MEQTTLYRKSFTGQVMKSEGDRTGGIQTGEVDAAAGGTVAEYGTFSLDLGGGT